MNAFSPRFALLALFLATVPSLLAAGDPAPAPAPTPPPTATLATKPAPATAPAAAPDVLALPKMQVTAERAKKIDKEIKRLDKMIAREKAKVKSTDLDKALNNEKVAKAAAIFGGNSADYLSAVAANRVALLEQERDVLEAMKRPTTLDELKMMETEIQQLRTTRRDLDDAAKQR
ncbi:MAG: hypothetical protein WDM96_02975 [Lacunisphaera sp.]